MTRRGTTNSNARGGTRDRLARRLWLVKTFRANVDFPIYAHFVDVEDENPTGWQIGEGLHACRCYRCGRLLTVNTVTVDRIVPGCRGGTYRRDNIRPSCAHCNSSTGSQIRSAA